MSKRSLAGMSSTRNNELTAIGQLAASRRVCGPSRRVEAEFLAL
jgi:hypothetical protein